MVGARDDRPDEVLARAHLSAHMPGAQQLAIASATVNAGVRVELSVADPQA